MLILDNIRHDYGDGNARVLVKGTLKVRSGDAVLVTGPNGAGKTTLLRIIAGLIPTFEGSITHPHEWRTVYVPASLDHLLMPWHTVQRNIAILCGDSEIAPKQVGLALAELLGRRSVDALLTRYVYQLSGGERAVLALACAARRRPEVLVADELFANTSPFTTGKMLEMVGVYQKAGGIVIVSNHHGEAVRGLRAEVLNLDGEEDLAS